MQFKWIEDFIVLAETRSFTKAAEQRHVTHPAFGRRIKALEDWMGMPLVERGGSPVALTPAGLALLELVADSVRGLEQARGRVQALVRQGGDRVVLATGRTLARTVFPDWLRRTMQAAPTAQLVLRTSNLADTARALEEGDADLALLYHHPVLAIQLDARRFTWRVVATDRLAPLTAADANGQAIHTLSATVPVPYLAYDNRLAMGRLVADHLQNHPHAPLLRTVLECDSADAQYEYVLRAAGVGWLPESMAQLPLRAGRLLRAGGADMHIAFEVRLYRPKKRLSAAGEAIWSALPGGSTS